jgi:hypothetical protein
MAQLSRVPKPWTTNTLVPPPSFVCVDFSVGDERYFDRFFWLYRVYNNGAGAFELYIGSGGDPLLWLSSKHYTPLYVVCVCAIRVLFLLDIRCIHI